MTPTFFAGQSYLRNYLEKNNKRETIASGFYKVDSGKQSFLLHKSFKRCASLDSDKIIFNNKK